MTFLFANNPLIEIRPSQQKEMQEFTVLQQFFNRFRSGILKLWYAWRGEQNVPVNFERLYLWLY